MARINDTTTYPNTAPALADHVIGTDVSDTTNSADGEVVTFTMQAISDLIEAQLSLNSRTLLATVATTSGSTVSATSLDFSGYSRLEFIYDGVSVSSAAAQSFIKVKFGSGTLYQHTDNIGSSASNTLNGIGVVDISTGSFHSIVAESDDETANASYAGTHGDVSSETSITWDWENASTFDAGQILVYGIK